MNIAVYSGSFNPLHIGHLAIMKHLTQEAGFDMVYLIVSPKNPLKDSISSLSARDRYNAAIEAVNRHFSPVPDIAECVVSKGCETKGKAGIVGTSAISGSAKVLVDDIELNMPEPHYSIRTLRALQEREPGNRFTLIMGADNLACFRNWKDYQSILTDFGIAVFPREGTDLIKTKQDLLDEDPAYKIQLLDAPLVTVSSSEIREALLQGKNISHLLM